MRIQVNAKGAARLLSRHLCVFRRDVVSGPETPGLYPVYWGRRFLALALYNPHTDLAVRAYRFAPAEDPSGAAAEVADLPRAVVTNQVRNGVAVRMAVLYLLLGSGVDLKPEVVDG